MHLRDGLQTRVTVAQRYDHLAARGEVTRDPAQERLARALDRLIGDICDKRISAKSSSLGWLFARRREQQAVRGHYIHGGVGRGKTMLMDLFFELVPMRRKRRAHFNDFMADVHDRINRHRQAVKRGEAKEDDPIPPVPPSDHPLLAWLAGLLKWAIEHPEQVAAFIQMILKLFGM